MRADPGVATDAKSNEITAICLTDTLIKCGGHDESVDVVGIHLIRFGRVQNQYRPPGLCWRLGRGPESGLSESVLKSGSLLIEKPCRC